MYLALGDLACMVEVLSIRGACSPLITELCILEVPPTWTLHARLLWYAQPWWSCWQAGLPQACLALK